MGEVKKIDKLALYNRVREVPDEAKKDIAAGRLKGKTDISPMWRIQTLTKEFGPAGIGWYTEIVESTIIPSGDEKAVYLRMKLYIREDSGEWSKPIEGFGGAMVVSKEKNGLYLDDDAYKKAYTDAISQACRSLGIGADVYWQADVTKYQREKAAAEVLQDALDHVESCETVEALDEGWAYYSQWLSDNETYRGAFVRRKRELSNGTRK